MKTEADITKEIRKYLDKLPGTFYWKQWQGGRRGKGFSKKGISDIIGSFRRFFNLCNCTGPCKYKQEIDIAQALAIEIKAEDKDMTPGGDQEKFILGARAMGWIAFQANSLDDVIRGLTLK